MKKATIQLETLTCPSCMAKIEGALKSLDGIKQDTLSVSFNTSKVKVDFDDSKVAIEDIQKKIGDLGYEVKKTQVKDL
ncbi:MAG: heavy-metal-associated domain-containing protein [Clostridiales bacterium]|nr:heavy-metal-associated domain-containing protein [Clostridiales bacterium]